MTPRPIRTLGLAGLLAFALPLGAQRRTTASTAPRPQEPLGYAPAPVVVSDGAFDVTLLTDASVNLPDGDRRMAEFYRACREQMPFPAADSSAIARSQPWDWSAGGTADPGTLTILVSRNTAAETDCRVSPALRAFAYARGYRVTTDTAYPYAASITGVSVQRADALIVPVDGERPALTRITPRGLVTVAGGLVRISVPIDSIPPDSLGEVADLVVRIATSDRPQPHDVRIPWWALRPIWRQMLVARARTLPGVRHVADAAILQRADPPMTEERRLEARVRTGIAFADAGDVAAARILLGEAVAAEPCLTLSAEVSAPAREIVARVRRPAARCVQNMPLTLVRAVALPGLGHVDTPRRRLQAAVTFGLVAGTLLHSQSTNAEARSLYDTYRGFDGTDPLRTSASAATLYQRAEDARARGTALVIAGAAIWGASVIEAAWTERRHQRRLARVQGMTPPSRPVGLAPFATPGGIGIALSLPAREAAR